MEAVTAFAVAGNVLQFLEFSSKLLTKSLEIYKSQDGLSKDRRVREHLLKDSILTFSGLDANVGNALNQQVETNVMVVDGVIKSLVGHSTVLAYNATNEADGSDDQIRHLAGACSSVANQLLQRIERLKVNGKKRIWSSLKGALSELWAQSDIESLQKSLDMYKTQLEFHVLISLRENVNLIASRQADQFDKLNSSMQKTIVQLLEDPSAEARRNAAPVSISPDDIKALDDQHKRTRVEIKSAINEALKGRNLDETQSNGHLDTSALTSAASHIADELLNIEKEILNSLKFAVMLDREEEISTAERATFDWIFEEQGDEDSRWHNFSQWLLHDKSVYWLTGKAGSGKSTLMKYIFCHQQTRFLLRKWTADVPLVVAGFFFWNSGAAMQKTQEGLLRSLLFQVLVKHRELMPVLFSDLKDYAMHELRDIWTLSRLTKAFERLIQQDIVPLKICFFIDGLDEYSGDHSALAELLKHASEANHIKVCAASRPLVVFEHAFEGYESLMLQRLTFDDISIYVQNKWKTHPRMVELDKEEPGLAERLGSEIVSKAAGVFLWVKVVVRSLLEGLTSYDRGSDLEKRLQELPEDLENLYLHMLQSIRPAFYFEQATKLLQITYHARKPLTILQLAYADMDDPRAALTPKLRSISDADQKNMCTQMEGRLKSRCLGLLEVSLEDSNGTDMRDRAVRFMHQSVADFLEKDDISSRMTASLKNDFSPFVCLMRSSLLDLKHLNTGFLPGRQPAMLIAQMWFRFAWAILAKFAVYAAKAETELRKPQPELIEELDRVATDLYQVYVAAECRFDLSTERALRPHWSERRQEGVNLVSIQTDGSLISWACEHQLYYFVQARLTTPKSQTQLKPPTSAQAKFALMVQEHCTNLQDRDSPIGVSVRDGLLKVRGSSSLKLGKLGRSWGTKLLNNRTSSADHAPIILKTRNYDSYEGNLEPNISAVAFNNLLAGTAFYP